MRSTQQFSITLTHEMAELVRAKVESGEYASESEVIRGGLRALQFQERALDNWLREQVAPAYDAMKANPSRAVSPAKVRASLDALKPNLREYLLGGPKSDDFEIDSDRDTAPAPLTCPSPAHSQAPRSTAPSCPPSLAGASRSRCRHKTARRDAA